ncbi:CcdB family protein [Vibrio cholerae]|uniref:CcdB family protein n=1 Tax=Vibrio cholerae TaxID=666 RepID=UPI00115A636B|nr:CcdB family protein [Vibrio cholerae]TQO83063.1 plasmid maintenance protein CcdB [Vibrio cholerae]TQO97443.1 plasmid maintenance protein CcdB [Vibrio cholerae]
MTQFTIYQNKNTQSKKEYPLLLDIQTNLLDSLQTTVVVPLKRLETNKDKVLTQLTPTFIIEGVEYLMLTPQLAGIQRKELGKAITDIEYARTDILNALDFLLTGI